MRIVISQQVQAFTWDFSGNNSKNGLAGTYSTGIQIPSGAIFGIFYFYCVLGASPDPNAGGNTLLIGTSLTNNLIATINGGNFNTSNTIQLGESNPPAMDGSLNILFTLTGPDLTSGIFKMIITYFQ